MRLFEKFKKKKSCCTIQIEEVKNEKKANKTSECCNFEIEEVKAKPLENKQH